MNQKREWVYDLLLIAVLIVAAYFRLLGLNWDENQHLHPDERFLTMVENALAPAKSLSEYFDTNASPLNPHNRGYAFFVYGDLPITIVRYLAEWTQQADYDHVNLVGRQVSAIADLGVIVLLYYIVARVYNRRTALLAAAFSSVAVMQIQQSHFFTVDNPANFFSFLAIFFAVWISTAKETTNDESRVKNASIYIQLTMDPMFWLSVAFGLSLGMAVASKLNAAPMAILLPAALALYHVNNPRKSADAENESTSDNRWGLIFGYLVAGGLATIFAFRIFQPYAFDGLGLNQRWMSNIRELQAQSSGDADVPFALQWARRSHLYSFENLTKWGLGLPLGIFAWMGFLVMGWRILKGERQHILLWGWTAIYFLWQSMAFNPTMRYQLPIYPLLCMMAAWLTFNVHASTSPSANVERFTRYALRVAGIVVLLLTAAWAYAFTRIYTRSHTRVEATRWIYANLPGPINLQIQTQDGIYQQPLPFSSALTEGTPFPISFTANASGELAEVYLPHIASLTTTGIQFTDPNTAPQPTPNFNPASPSTLSLILTLTPDAPPEQVLARAQITDLFPASARDPRGSGFTFTLDKPLQLVKDQNYYLILQSIGMLELSGAAPINETSWDDGLPLRLGNYDGYGGIYNGGLNLEMYWDDNIDKVNRFSDTLNKGDYIFVTSNRQWASVTRIPERYPLTTAYYRALIGCPVEQDVIWCYNVAKPGQFQGQLGYELVKVFESYPTLEVPSLFQWEWNDQFAEEAFTVYDHTKVLIFKKGKDFDPAKLLAFLNSVDISNVVHLTPKQASAYKSPLLSADAFAKQRALGTWSELFSYEWIQNQYPVIGLLIWYIFVFLLGLAAYPLARLALPGLVDRGYALSRVVGLVMLAYLSWMSGSLGLGFTRANIGVICMLIVAAGLGLGWTRRDELKEEWKSNKKYFILIEGIFLAFFVIDLLIRLGNPDLWHPAKGGERPMDFSYFNAIMKSESFPPYDPWFAGGYINYYYYGFVIVGTPVKLLGIVPSIAYNFILPTLFALVALGAFSVGYNLIARKREEDGSAPFLSGIAASLLTVLFGNLGTIRMLYQGFQRMAAPDGNIVDANIAQRLIWAVKGFASFITGASLPFVRGDWYWLPSRVIPAPGDVEPITEFPLFTFLYSDLHAHMIAMPLTLFIIAWAISCIKSRARLNLWEWVATFIVGALFIGALKPTNTWDLYTYFPLAALCLIYAIWNYAAIKPLWNLPEWTWRVALALGAGALLYALASAFYLPFTLAFSPSYGAVASWTGTHTPIWSYFTQWGLFLFIIVAWMAWETREWMASTPVSALKKLQPYHLLIELTLATMVALMIYFAFKEISVGWLALPLAAWAGILLTRKDMPDERRLVLFMIGTALALTIAVELIVLVGDIGRMNTVFKLYLQAWMLLATSAAASFGWLLTAFPTWKTRWKNIYQSGVWLLAGCAFLFTITASMDKINDRMAVDAPHSFDSMEYMAHATYWDADTMDLSEDYRAIRWMQDTIKGSPVIVEMNCPEYRWCSRFTIYTGLPGVAGWNWHQRQQRGSMSVIVEERVAEIGEFYSTQSESDALAFLKKYGVKYIIVGQLERIYAPDGISKFAANDGKLWKSIYRDGQTVIYEVLP